MLRAGRTEENHHLATNREAHVFVRRVNRGALYQTPTLDLLRLLSMVNLTSEFPRSEIACET
jgi:hypothetical protein